MIEVKSNALFLSTFGVKIDVKNERKRVSRMCENAYLSIKNPKASKALKRALDPSCRLLASLMQLYFTTSATFGLKSWAPLLDQILDPHLIQQSVIGSSKVIYVYGSSKVIYGYVFGISGQVLEQGQHCSFTLHESCMLTSCDGAVHYI